MRPEGCSWPEPGGGTASAACMEPKVCPSVLLPLISHSFVLSLGGAALLSFGGASRGSSFCDGVVALGRAPGLGHGDFVRDHALPACFFRLVSVLRARGRSFLGAGSGVDLAGRVSWPRACARFLLSVAGGRLLGFHGVFRIRGRRG